MAERKENRIHSRSRSRSPSPTKVSRSRSRSFSPSKEEDKKEGTTKRVYTSNQSAEAAFAFEWKNWHDEGETSITVDGGKLNVSLAHIDPRLQNGTELDSVYLEDMGMRHVHLRLDKTEWILKPVRIVYELEKVEKI